ncbi:MAG: HAMP domain-containing sensor histidine kinase [Pseudomonadota bacterium]
MDELAQQDVIVLVGAGQGGKAILTTLLRIPGITVEYVIDTDANAPGILLAREKGIPFRSDGCIDELAGNSKIDLILEVTGNRDLFKKIREIKHPDTALISSTGMRIIWHLLETQRRVAEKLEAYKKKLERRIVERTEEIEKANRDLEEKIVQYEKLNQELVNVNEEKTSYLLRATHHLKAPFAAIQSYTDIILDGYTGEITDQTRDIVNKIRIRCELLSSSIKDMLELANLRTTDREKIRMEDESLNEILFDAIEAHTVIANTRGIQFVFKPLGGPDKVHCNRGQVKALFAALIENAVNYSHNNSKVEIFFEKRGERKFGVSVRDHGIGISEANQSKIFSDYFRTNEAVRKHENGTGLGLAIVREVSKLHNFSIDVESQPEKGATFTITVPLVTDAS